MSTAGARRRASTANHTTSGDGPGWESGFTYIGMLIVIAAVTISVGVVGQTWKSLSRIEKEKQLIWVGHQYRNALRSYHMTHLQRLQQQIQAGAHGQVDMGNLVFRPQSLDDLLKDPIAANTLRHLRKKYTDPMTGKDDWVLMLDDKQHIKGVHSASDAAPLKIDNFDQEDEKFKGKQKYSDWLFDYDPNYEQPVVVTTSTGI